MRRFLTSILEKITEKIRIKDNHKATSEDDKVRIESQRTEKKPKKRKKKDKKDIASDPLLHEISQHISPQKMKLISIAGDIRLDPDKTESAFMARQLVQATLPHKNPGNVGAWSRTNGGLTLTIRPGWDEKKNEVIGYPYGTIPRLLLFWITTEAIRTKSPQIELGNNLAAFMEELGLDPKRGGARSDVRRMQDQMRRLFQSTISFSQKFNKGEAWLNMQVAPKGMFWWDDKQPNQKTLWKNWIKLGEDFFEAVMASPVPVDMRIIKALKRSPLALDFYTWATYTAYQTEKTGSARTISWGMLHQQFGAEYKDVKDFSKKSWRALMKVQAVYPDLTVERIDGGIKVLPSKPSITIKKKRQKETP